MDARGCSLGCCAEHLPLRAFLGWSVPEGFSGVPNHPSCPRVCTLSLMPDLGWCPQHAHISRPSLAQHSVVVSKGLRQSSSVPASPVQVLQQQTVTLLLNISNIHEQSTNSPCLVVFSDAHFLPWVMAFPWGISRSFQT